MIATQRVLIEKRAIIVPLVLLAIANVVLYVVVVFPLGRQVRNAEIDQHAAHEQVNAARLEHKMAKNTVIGKQSADSALQKFYKDVLPSDSSRARYVTYTRLMQIAKQTNVHLERGLNAITSEKGSSLKKVTTTYTLTGDYRDVRKFIYALETTPEFIVLENVALTSAGEGPQLPNKGLAVNLEIATYFRPAGVHVGN